MKADLPTISFVGQREITNNRNILNYKLNYFKA